MKRIFLIIVLCGGFMLDLKAQDSSSTLHHIEGVDIVGKKPSIDHIPILPEEKSKNLGDLLAENSGGYIKKNGVVGLSSLNVGGIGGQRAVLNWQGVNLQSKMNGFADLWMLPSFLFSQVGIGLNASDMPLNGGLGGGIKLGNFSHSDEILLSLGSFSNKQIGLGINLLDLKKLKSSIKVYHAKGDNDFEFTSFTNKIKKQTHADAEQTHFVWQNSYSWNEKNNISFSYWGMKSKRNLPPTLFEAISGASQKDRNHRLALTFTHKGKGEEKWNSYALKGHYIDEYIGFKDDIKKSKGENFAKSFYSQYQHGFHWHNYVNDVTTSVFFQTQGSLHHIKTLSYDQDKKKENIALMARFQQKAYESRWVYNGTIRLEHFLDETLIGYTATADYRFNDKRKVSIYGGRCFQYPSFNDLYWIPGGNPDLKPERGFKGHFSVESKSRKLQWSAQIHSSFIEDWILWLPGESAIWSAINAQKVWAKGLRFKYKKNVRIRTFWLSLDGVFAFNQTTNQGGNKWVSKGKKMIYVPQHSFLQNFVFWKSSFKLNWQIAYTGKRFTNAANTESLDGFLLHNVSLSYRKKDLTTSFTANNLFDKVYQSTLTYPMPLSQFQLSIHYNFKNLRKKYVSKSN